MSIPYVGYGNETLAKMPAVKDGEPIICPRCQGTHNLEAAKDKDGNKTDVLMFYRCGEGDFLGAVAGKLVAGLKADVSGKI